MAEVKRLLGEVGSGMRQHGPPMFEIGSKLKDINKTLKSLGRDLFCELFDYFRPRNFPRNSTRFFRF